MRKFYKNPPQSPYFKGGSASLPDSMKIVADEHIPLVDYYFGSLGELVLKSGRLITKADVQDALILIIRTVTKINKDLLENTQVKFVGSVMTGTDHMDMNWLTDSGISFAVAKGCNSVSVVDYVLCVMAALQTDGLLTVSKPRVGVIGVGRIGSLLVQRLKKMGIDVIEHDPIRAQKEKDFVSTPLSEFKNLDLVTLHTPLTKEGPYPTFHMIGKEFLQQQKSGCILLNTSRGSVVNFADLKQHGQHLHWCLDVWENEPDIDLYVLRKALIATPHIAGHSIQSKYRGIKMIYEAALNAKVIPNKNITPIPYPTKKLILDSEPEDWREVVLKIYDPRETTHKMKEAILTTSSSFDFLRNHFPARYEFEFMEMPHSLPW